MVLYDHLFALKKTLEGRQGSPVAQSEEVPTAAGGIRSFRALNDLLKRLSLKAVLSRLSLVLPSLLHLPKCSSPGQNPLYHNRRNHQSLLLTQVASRTL